MQKVVRGIAGLAIACGLARGQTTSVVSVDANGAQPDGPSTNPAITPDRHFVAFMSSASDLVAVDTNGKRDVFVRDLDGRTNELVSVATGGAQGNEESKFPSISDDGRYVAFVSLASNLAPNDTNNGYDVFVRDRQMGTTEMVSVLTGGSSSPTGVSDNASISGNGRYVLFSGGSWSSNPTNRLLVRDLPAQTTAFVDRTWQGNTAGAAPQNPVISDNGRYVVFMSLQGDVVAGDSNATWDVFVRDVQLGTVERVSVDSGELEGNGSSQTPAAISDDGRYVAFTSFATNLDAHDSNAQADVFVRDRVLGTTELASAGANGLSTGGTSNSGAAQPLHMSADGRFVAFISTGDFVNGGAVFSSGAFLRDRLHGTTEAIDVTSSGTQVRSVGALDLTDDGRYVAFDTNSAVPLAAGFTDWNVFLRDRNAAGPWAYGVGQSNSLGCASTVSSSGTPSASAGSGFAIDCSNVLNGRPGLLFYSTRGPNAAPFLGGFLYCKAPTLRTALQNSGGSTSGDDCTGHFSYDFNTRIASGVDANLTAGSDVWAQYWSRDPASPSATNLSSAITFTIGA